jgi:hypothetical protein
MLYVNNKTLVWYSFDICHEAFKCHAIMLKWFNKLMPIYYMKHTCVPHALILFLIVKRNIIHIYYIAHFCDDLNMITTLKISSNK